MASVPHTWCRLCSYCPVAAMLLNVDWCELLSRFSKARFGNELKANVTIGTIPKLRVSHQKALQ